MNLYIARHGQTDWNLERRCMGRQDIPLNSTGIAQAEALRERLEGINFDICYASPLSRARQTAEIVCNNRCDIIFNDDLQERAAGDLEGKIITDWNDFAKDSTAESDAEILARAQKVLDYLLKQDFQNVIIVSHGGLIRNLRACIAEYLGIEFDPTRHIGNCEYELVIL